MRPQEKNECFTLGHLKDQSSLYNVGSGHWPLAKYEFRASFRQICWYCPAWSLVLVHAVESALTPGETMTSDAHDVPFSKALLNTYRRKPVASFMASIRLIFGSSFFLLPSVYCNIIVFFLENPAFSRRAQRTVSVLSFLPPAVFQGQFTQNL